MLPPDLHIHSKYCGHAEGSMSDTVQNAIDIGFETIGFADHFPYPPGYVEPFPDCVIPRDVFSVYWKEIGEIQKKFSNQIQILSGIEVDYLPGFTDLQKQELSQYNFDYYIGSIHILDSFPIDTSEELTQQALAHYGSKFKFWDRYWAGIIDMLDTDVCDILGHLDLLKKFLPIDDYSPFMEKITYILERVKYENRAIDFNLGGIDRAFDKTPYPSQAILERAAEIGVDVSLGSDAHKPDQVGRYFSLAIEMLKSMGWKHVIYFKERNKEYVKI